MEKHDSPSSALFLNSFVGAFSSVGLGHNSSGSSLKTSLIAQSKDKVSELVSENLSPLFVAPHYPNV